MGDSTSIGPEPVAIVGLAGRFPGDASSPDRLWQLIYEGRNALSEVPPDRYNIDAFYHPSAERIGTQNARGGYFSKRNPQKNKQTLE
jgi:acyl transferase domain-containing protein